MQCSLPGDIRRRVSEGRREKVDRFGIPRAIRAQSLTLALVSHGRAGGKPMPTAPLVAEYFHKPLAWYVTWWQCLVPKGIQVSIRAGKE